MIESLREYLHWLLVIGGMAMFAFSWWRKKRRPSAEEMRQLAKYGAALLVLIVFLGYLLAHKNSELGGQALLLSAVTLFLAFEAFNKFFDTAKPLWSSKLDTPTPPSESGGGVRVANDSTKANDVSISAEDTNDEADAPEHDKKERPK